MKMTRMKIQSQLRSHQGVVNFTANNNGSGMMKLKTTHTMKMTRMKIQSWLRSHQGVVNSTANNNGSGSKADGVDNAEVRNDKEELSMGRSHNKHSGFDEEYPSNW